MDTVPQYGVYGGVLDDRHFHVVCVQSVIDEPEEHGHAMVDRAMLVLESIRDKKVEDVGRRKRQKERIEEIKNADFWGDMAMKSLLE